MKVVTRRYNFTVKERKSIQNLYLGKKFSIQKLADLYKTSWTVMSNRLDEWKVIKRSCGEIGSKKYDINENFFDIIDTPDKAYFLGWMFSDGCVSKNVAILDLIDKEIVEKFKKVLEAEAPIKLIKHKVGQLDTFRLNICRKRIVESLVKIGCVSAKSLILDWPNSIPDNLIHFFLRGFFEGDGYIYSRLRHNRMYYKFKIVSSKKFAYKLSKFILKKLKIRFRFNIVGNSGLVTSANKKKILQFLDWIYEDRNDLILKRKFERYLIIKKT